MGAAAGAKVWTRHAGAGRLATPPQMRSPGDVEDVQHLLALSGNSIVPPEQPLPLASFARTFC